MTLEEGLAARLEARRQETGQTFKEVVNELLLAGLNVQRPAELAPFDIEPVDLGRLKVGFHGRKIADVLEELDDYDNIPMLVHDGP